MQSNPDPGLRPSLRWHECLEPLANKQPGDEQRNKFAYKQGWKVHEAIQRDFPDEHAEKPDTFSDPSLPFDIGYHCDLYSEKLRLVREIKPLDWFTKNVEYCVAQLSGYMHFKNAAGIFLLYEGKDYVGTRMPYVRTWDELKAIALQAWEQKQT